MSKHSRDALPLSLRLYREAVEEEIARIHALGLPVYQSKNGYIVAIYPGNREVRIQKEIPYKKKSLNLGSSPV